MYFIMQNWFNQESTDERKVDVSYQNESRPECEFAEDENVVPGIRPCLFEPPPAGNRDRDQDIEM